MKIIAYFIALNIPNADPQQVAAALSLGLAIFKSIKH